MDDSKTILTNVNVEEYKENPEEFENLRERRPVGAQVFIQFKDSDDKVVGESIQLDSYSNKAELNMVLTEMLQESGLQPEQTHIEQVYQFFLGENEVR